MVRNHKLAKSISDASWSEFARQLEYKCEWYGKRLVRVDSFYPSSQFCGVCGKQNSAVKDLAVREWECPECGVIHEGYKRCEEHTSRGLAPDSVNSCTYGTAGHAETLYAWGESI